MSRSARRGLYWVALSAAVFGLATLTLASRAGGQEPTVRLELPSDEVTVGDAAFAVEVVVEDVADLGAFEFHLVYDASILRFVEVTEGPFLGSSGRVVECLEPRLTAESVRFVCVTLGRLPAGPDGSGTLATVALEPVGPGTSPLRFDVLTLTQPNAQQIPAAAEDASIAVAPAPGQATPMPVATPTTAPAGTPLAETPAGLATTETATAQGTATMAPTPASGGTADDGGTNWSLWGSLIGVAGVVVVGAAGVAWWWQARRST